MYAVPILKTRENECIACLEGFTSDTGQNCKPCPKNTYGEKCGYVCSCLDLEVCDNVKGCVPFASTTGSSMYATADASEKRLSEKNCYSKTESGEKLEVCCADFEEKGNDCNACLKGFTSDMGQQCRPCSDHFYGEKCGFKCFCTDYEMCDHVKGCVQSPSTSGYSAYVTSTILDKSTFGTSFEKNTKDITSSYRVESTNAESTDCSVQGRLLFRELIVYSSLSVLVIGLGICLGLGFFKYKTITQKYTATINQTQIPSTPQQIQTIEIADRLYDIINEEDILDDRRIQQIQMSSEYIDVIHDSNIRESCESKSLDKQDNPCQLLSIIQTLNQVRNLKVEDRSLMSGDSTSSSDEYQWDSTQDYLNPYQPMIDHSLLVENKYLTIAIAHSRVDGDYTDSAKEINKYELQHPREMEMDPMTNLHDSYKSSSVNFRSNVSKGVSIMEGGRESKSNENLNVEEFNRESE